MKFCLAALVFFHSSVCAQWSRISDIPASRTVYALFAAHDTLYVGTDSLFYIGTHRGANWLPERPPVSSPDAVECLLKSGGTLLAGTFKNGIFTSTDEGASWHPFSNGLSGLGSTDIGSLLVRRDSLIAGTLGAGVFTTSADLSRQWSAWGDSLSAYEGDNVFKMLVVGTTVLAGAGANGYMFRYTDDQPWWNPVAMNTPRLIGELVTGLATNGLGVVAATNLGVYRSTDQGLSWVRTGFSIPPSTIQTLLSFHGTEVFAIVTSPLSSSLFVSPDTGNVWMPLGVFALPDMIDAAFIGDTLFLGGEGGLWEAPLSELLMSAQDPIPVPHGFSLEQNYPNPFNPTTIIEYTVGGTGGQGSGVSTVRLVVYDILGREVATLVDEVKRPGTYKVEFDVRLPPRRQALQPAGLSSGVYVYRLTAGEFSQARALILLK